MRNVNHTATGQKQKPDPLVAIKYVFLIDQLLAIKYMNEFIVIVWNEHFSVNKSSAYYVNLSPKITSLLLNKTAQAWFNIAIYKYNN